MVTGGVPRPATEVYMTCGFCGSRFVEDPGQAACQACPLSRACGLVRCPQCGFENPRPPAWITRLWEWVSR
jgi:hypothetical protein